MNFVEDLLRDELGFGAAEFDDFYKRAEVIPFEHRGEVTGAIVMVGNEIHCMPAPGKRGYAASRRSIIKLLSELLEKHTFLTTRIPISTPDKDRTGERLGFTYTWSDDRFDYYICTGLPYGRK